MFSLNKSASMVMLALISAGVIGASSAHAQLVGSPVQGSAASEIAKINEEIAVLTAKLNKLKVQADIAAKTKEIETQNAALDAGAMMQGGQNAAPSMGAMGRGVLSAPAEIETPAPAIHSIEGADGKLYATLIFSGGMNQIVQKGEVIKDGWKVVGLTSSSVTLSRGGKETRLGFGLPAAASNERAPGYGAPSGYTGAPIFQ